MVNWEKRLREWLEGLGEEGSICSFFTAEQNRLLDEYYKEVKEGEKMKIKPVALGLTLGIVWGGVLFVTTLLSYFTGYAKSFLEVIAENTIIKMILHSAEDDITAGIPALLFIIRV